MNKERMLILADLLDSLPEEKFDLTFWVNDRDKCGRDDDCVNLSVYNCNTTACIAGWAVALKNDLSVEGLHHYDVDQEAGEYLDLSYYERERLFYYGESSIWNKYAEDLGCEMPFENTVTNKMAATAVRNIAQGKWELV